MIGTIRKEWKWVESQEKKMVYGLIVGTASADAWAARLRQEAGKAGGSAGTVRKLRQCEKLDEEILRETLAQWEEEPGNCFCVVETDAAADAAGRLGIPCIAYCNPQLEEQKFSGVKLLLEGFEEIDWKFLDGAHTRALGLPVEIARTEHLIIREMVVEDLNSMYELYEDAEVSRFVKEGLDENRTLEEERTKAYIHYMYGLYQFGMWAVLEKATGKLIGRAGFGIADYRGQPELDLGYLIGKSWRNRGLACEACQAVLDYGREELGFPQVSAYIHEENAPSLAVAGKLGFVQKGRVEADGERLLWFVKELA